MLSPESEILCPMLLSLREQIMAPEILILNELHSRVYSVRFQRCSRLIAKNRTKIGWPTLLFGVLGLIGGSQTVEAQIKDTQSSLLRITTEGLLGLDRGCKADEGLIVQLHYTGEKPLRGHVVTFDSPFHRAGKPMNDEVLEEARSPREPMIVSGQEWTRIICSIPISGPIKSQESQEVLGMIAGIDAARNIER
jgi:hypothetical protein